MRCRLFWSVHDIHFCPSLSLGAIFSVHLCSSFAQTLSPSRAAFVAADFVKGATCTMVDGNGRSATSTVNLRV